MYDLSRMPFCDGGVGNDNMDFLTTYYEFHRSFRPVTAPDCQEPLASHSPTACEYLALGVHRIRRWQGFQESFHGAPGAEPSHLLLVNGQ